MQNKGLFEKYKEGKHWEKHPTKYAESFTKFLKKSKFNGLLVDVGCGNGRDVNYFYNHHFNVKGIDNSIKEILTARKNFPLCKFEAQNAEKLKFLDNSINAYFIINVIHYVNMKKALSEIYRTLKKRGYLFIHFNVYILNEDGHFDYEHRLEDIFKLVSDFKIIKKKIFRRVDNLPYLHTHKIIEFILQKE